VSSFIREQLLEKIFPKYGLDAKDEQWYLNLVIATDSKTTDLEVRGPDVRKRQKFIDYGLWLPYTINQTEYPLASYLDQLFRALVIVFSNYGVSEMEIKEIEAICKKKILGNENYLT
jgi:hypothetical protein